MQREHTRMRLLIPSLLLLPLLLMLLPAPAFLLGPPSRASRVAALPGLTASRLTPSRRFVFDIWRRPHLAPLNSHAVNSTTAGISGPPPHLPANTVEPMHTPPPPPPASMESASSFLYWMVSWPKRDLLPEIRPALLLNVAWTAAVVRLFELGYVTPIDPTPHSLLSGALGFFLTFRANEGYARCNEARKVWDSVMNSSRDLVRSAIAVEALLGRRTTQRLIDLTCAFGIALEEFVWNRRRSRELQSLLLLNDRDLAALENAANAPLAVVELLTLELSLAAQENKGFADSVHFPRMLAFADDLGHHVTSCQRLLKPPVPPVYYGHALRFLTLWTFSLPFALLKTIPGPMLVPAVGFVTWALFGLRELGVKTQYPFSIGLVKLRDLWKEVVWDARTCYESSHMAKDTDTTAYPDGPAHLKKDQ